MRHTLLSVLLIFPLFVFPFSFASADPATLTIHADKPSANKIPLLLTGKFAEHLGSNIDNGMSAQILRNPTFADYPFVSGGQTPDGWPRILSDDNAIADNIRRAAERLGWPTAAVGQLVESRKAALGHFWIRAGEARDITCSPDVGPSGGRAQRVELRVGGCGVAQYTFLPLHRVRKYEYRIVVRSPEITSLKLTITAEGQDKPAGSVAITGVSTDWSTLTGSLELRTDAPADSIYRVSLTSDKPGQLVIARLLLYPADHVGGAEPDIIRLLKESHLPLLRWPGGNFVSGYHWRDGIGPQDARPTRMNPAWGGLENNRFGTDEFIAFCRAVGCEPMICINGGDGTPEEAAEWIHYCNDPATTPLGSLRAKNGHPQPYNVKLWEVGNELWGHWQVQWTTPAGYADRYRRFAPLMQKVDPTITLYACGAPVLWGRDWNLTLFKQDADIVTRTTDHPLVGGNVPASTDPLDVYRDFMAVPDLLGRKWAQLRDDMEKAGVKNPRLAVTELQLFAHLQGQGGPLTRETLVTPATHAEALYDTLLYHRCVELLPFVDFVTQSAIVNHGGGLRKERERVYANPCHYAQSAFAAFNDATPLVIDLKCPTEKAPLVLPEVKPHGPVPDFSILSAVAARAADGSLLVSIVHRGTSGSVKLTITLDGSAGKEANLWQLTAAKPWAANTLVNPKAVAPTESAVNVTNSVLTLEIAPYTVARLRIPPK